MNIPSVEVTGIYLGQLKTIGPAQSPTGIYKEAVTQPQFISCDGLEGDYQADRRVHGGPEKAVYHYPAEHYDLLRAALPHLSDHFIPGSIGENLSTTGLTDNSVHIGDIFRLGTALVQVSQPRRPCWKVNHKYGNGHIGALLMSEGITGWYYRVLEPGKVQPGDKTVFIERLENSIAVSEVWEIFISRLENNLREDTGLHKIPGLSAEWSFS